MCDPCIYIYTHTGNDISNSNCSTWDLRLSGMTPSSNTEAIEGRLELCYNRNWFLIQDHHFFFDIYSICSKLGYGINTGKNCQYSGTSE